MPWERNAADAVLLIKSLSTSISEYDGRRDDLLTDGCLYQDFGRCSDGHSGTAAFCARSSGADVQE